MRTTTYLGAMLLCLGLTRVSHAQEAYPLAYNFQFVPSYEYVNTMAMSSDNKDHYSIFIVVYQNKGNQRLPVNDEYEIITSKGEKHKAEYHPMVKRDVEARRKFSAVGGKIKFIEPGATAYVIAIFDRLSDSTPAFQFRIHGLPDGTAQPNKQMVVADYEHLKDTVEKNPTTAKDPNIVWEPEPIQYNPIRQVGRWRLKKILRQNEP